jgi:hypothetical protein
MAENSRGIRKALPHAQQSKTEMGKNGCFQGYLQANDRI